MAYTHIGVLGAAFDPPTNGHKDVVNQSLSKFDHVLLVPCIKHAFGKEMSDIDDRINMLEMFKHQFDEDKVSISLVEEVILAQKHSGPVYTYDVLTALSSEFPQSKLTFIIGPDNEKVWHKFYKADEIVQRWDVFIAHENIAAHSSDARSFATKNDITSLKSIVEDSVADYIIQQQLYQK